MAILTQYQKDKYLNDPNKCPFCEGADINAGECEPTTSSVYREVECENCGEKWDEEFELSNISTQEERDEQV